MPKKKPGRNRRKPCAKQQEMRTAQNKYRKVKRHVEAHPEDHQSAKYYAELKKSVRATDNTTVDST